MKYIETLLLCVLVIVAIGLVLSTTYYVPDGRLQHEEMTFERFVKKDSGGIFNNRYSSSVAILRRGDGSEFRIYSHGYVVLYARTHLESGDEVEVTWFNPCHEFVDVIPGSCIKALAINDMDIHKVIRAYLKHRKDTFILFGLLCFFCIYILISGLVYGIKNEKNQ